MLTKTKADRRAQEERRVASPGTVVVVPVHDERENLEALVPSLLRLELSMLFVEDASTDESGEYLDRLASCEPRLSVLHRPALLGLGTAYVEGFRRAVERGFERVVEMDADLSHDPAEIPRLLAALDRADLVVGSRYVGGGSTPGWPLRRRLLSRFGGLYTRLWTGIPINDPTSGFRAFRASTLAALDLPSIQSRGFAFQVEVLVRAHAAGLRIAEVPITFRERVHGRSKLSPWIVLEALRTVPRLRRVEIPRGRGFEPDWTPVSTPPVEALGGRRARA
ncbi:MAG TPA: polyprenol monophosphomannose synthase [Planctomycetota bacterium]|jgi:dolichol-phosphate mannosyltransferase|nr:polyprenol monophosphomannose synthase [Planctomycetota bacterium]